MYGDIALTYVTVEVSMVNVQSVVLQRRKSPYSPLHPK